MKLDELVKTKKNAGEFIYSLYKDPCSKLMTTFPKWESVKEHVFDISYIVNLKENFEHINFLFDNLISNSKELKNLIEASSPEFSKIENQCIEYLIKYYDLIQELFHCDFFTDDNRKHLIQALRTGFVETVVGCTMWSPDILESLLQFYQESQKYLYNGKVETSSKKFVHSHALNKRFKELLSKKGICCESGYPWTYNYEFDQKQCAKVIYPSKSISLIPLNFILNKISNYIYNYNPDQVSVAYIGDVKDEELKDFTDRYNQLHSGIPCKFVVIESAGTYIPSPTEVPLIENKAINIVRKEIEIFTLSKFSSFIDADITFFANSGCIYESGYRFNKNRNQGCIFEKNNYITACEEANLRLFKLPIDQIVNTMEVMGASHPTDTSFDHNELYFRMNMPFFTRVKEWAESLGDKKVVYIASTEKESMLYEPDMYRDYMAAETWSGENFYVWEFGDRKTLQGAIDDTERPKTFSSTFTLFDLLNHLDHDSKSFDVFENLNEILNPEISTNIILKVNYHESNDLEIQIQCSQDYLSKYEKALDELKLTMEDWFATAFIHTFNHPYSDYLKPSIIHTMECSVETLNDAIQCSLFKHCYHRALNKKSKLTVNLMTFSDLKKPAIDKSAPVDYLVIDHWVQLFCNKTSITRSPEILSMLTQLGNDQYFLQKYKLSSLKEFIEKLTIIYI